MSMHLFTNNTLEMNVKDYNNFKKSWMYQDGTLKTDYFVKNEKSSKKIYKNFKFLYQKIVSTMIVSPLFLSVLISIIVVVPFKILSLKNLTHRFYNFLKRLSKRGVDIIGAMLGLLLSGLLFLLIPILIKLDSHGNIIFKQLRIGKNSRKKDRRMISLEVPLERRQSDRRKDDLLGTPFVVYKFRSMKNDAEKKTGPVWASNDDPRVTNIGKVLRPYHLDELPQFINVLKGEMSLVGPRPERPEFVCKLKSKIPNYEQRFNSKPGLTGLAQINCGYDNSIEDVKNKLIFDLHYVKNSHIIKDIKIIWSTFKNLTSIKNGK